MEEEQPKRGRGRPKGSLNKKTLEKQAALKEATTLDVSFEEKKEEEPEQVEEPEKAEDVEEVAEEEVAEEPEVEPEPVVEEPPKKQRKPRKPKPPEEAPEPPPPPSPKKRKPRAPPREVSPELSYLEVLKRGMAAAKATQRAERLNRYDSYFSLL